MSARKRIGSPAGLVAGSRAQFPPDYGEHDYYFWLLRETPKATSLVSFVCVPVQPAFVEISFREHDESQESRLRLRSLYQEVKPRLRICGIQINSTLHIVCRFDLILVSMIDRFCQILRGWHCFVLT